MIKRSNAGDELVKPDVISFNTVSKLYSHASCI
jgi:hypothetical protein